MEEIENNMPGINSLFDSDYTIVATLKSITDTNDFCNAYNHYNNYNGLRLGQRIFIKGDYNDLTGGDYWYIAGFDYEFDNVAMDGTSNNNGYGICLIPTSPLNHFDNRAWTYNNTSTPYISSNAHMSLLPLLTSSLIQSSLGDHLINRNVLLSSKTNSTSGKSTTYTWTTAYCTLMSVGQITGEFSIYKTKYDDGEANYKLPLFNYLNPSVIGYPIYTRCIYGKSSSGDYRIYYVGKATTGPKVQVFTCTQNEEIYIIPLIYIR